MPDIRPANPLRRALLLGAAAGGATLAQPTLAQTPAPAELGLTEALRARRSTRAFRPDALAPPLLAELLWAAFGQNRPAPAPGLHTAPSYHGVADVRVWLATEGGVTRYDPESDSAAPVLDRDIRPILSPQPFVATAPASLVLLSDLSRVRPVAAEEERRLYGMVDAAMVAENVYLFAAARGLGTCLVGGLDRAAISTALGLKDHEFPAFVQPVGWPA